MTRFLPVLLAGTALSACATTYDSATATTAEIETENEVVEQLSDDPAGQAELGNYGFDIAGMDSSVDAGDDFYAYANGVWAANTEIPDDKTNYGMFTALSDLSEERTQGIIDEMIADPSSRVGIAYRAYVDTDTIDAKGLAPIQPILDKIDAIESFDDYARVMAELDIIGIGGKPFGVFVGQDRGNSERYLTSVYQSGTSLPDRDYYLDLENERFAKVREALVDTGAKLLTMIGEDNARARAEAMLAFETELAKIHWDRNKLSDSEATYNLSSFAELKALAPEFDWDTYVAVNMPGKSVDELNIGTPDSIAAGVKLAAEADLQVLKDKARLSAITGYSSVLPTEVDDTVFAFQSVLTGQPSQRERWKRGVSFVSGNLRDDLGKVYAERYFPAETKAEMQKLVDNVVVAMRDRILTADWMAEPTKAQAIDKLNRFTVKIGYPDKWMDYDGLTMVEGDAFGNAVRANEWGHWDSVNRLGGPIQRWRWGMAPMTVNAYANFGMMEIVFPASILQAPFFDPNADAAYNYGGIGAVIGHEISHHFDDQGAKYDSNGNLNNWWTEEDYANFEARGKALIEQYNTYEIFPGEYVDGEFTLGENIGDLAGLSIAYDAYRASLGGEEAPVLDGLTGDQRFFLGWAQVWRRNYRDEELKNRLKTDSHSPSIQRTWVVRNMDAWYDAFSVDADDAMYLPPEERVTVW
ncbi:M13 family metallopeptidase [Sphingomicrobium clamense]|uniref:M13 family metallopeptidase n=1 Tax=Sphingomicrobium clamense TaxID=2851013 RepID=A0ABS6V625_9SPHN|nr:M13 family metallopeptidase [Sphingomicrobium sp. B8]MBW0145002.1 M13 family metallopeptidase [Sphingomicrobium sp. B8]